MIAIKYTCMTHGKLQTNARISNRLARSQITSDSIKMHQNDKASVRIFRRNQVSDTLSDLK